MHLQPVFADRPSYTNGTSERLFRTGLSLPSGSALTDDQFDRVLSHVRTFLEGKILVTDARDPSRAATPPSPASTITITGGTGSVRLDHGPPPARRRRGADQHLQP